jgi:uncharacterized protein involved in exopolysaccharide biosynthesis
MTDTQLYLAVGMPTIAILLGILINGLQFHRATADLSARISTIETSINARISTIETSINARFASLEARLASVETRLDILIGKMMDFDGRLSRLEERREKH